MATDMTGQLANPQEIEVAVSGPDGANRLYVCTGSCDYWLPTSPGPGQPVAQEVTFHVGPQLGRREFIRAVCAVGLTGYLDNGAAAPGPAKMARVQAADADWNDETGRVQGRVTLEAANGAGVTGFHYHITILAERAAT